MQSSPTAAMPLLYTCVDFIDGLRKNGAKTGKELKAEGY